MKYQHLPFLIVLLLIGITGCKDDPASAPEPLDPDSAPVVSIDRFSDAAGNLFQRSSNTALPAANAPVNFDQGPFITKGFGPSGQIIEYYNFDVMPTTPAPIYVLFEEGSDTPVAGQLNIVNVIPGETGYNDFWQVHKVTVPEGYVANTVTSYEGIMEEGFTVEATNILVNCPIVPEGSTASKRFTSAENTGLVRGWYKKEVVFYFSFEEKALMAASGLVPTSPIYVTFNINAGEDGGGPPSGFKTETGNDQSHNVAATVPSDNSYSPLWVVNIYDNANFDQVSDLGSAQSANILVAGAAIVNCPIVSLM